MIKTVTINGHTDQGLAVDNSVNPIARVELEFPDGRRVIIVPIGNGFDIVANHGITMAPQSPGHVCVRSL